VNWAAGDSPFRDAAGVGIDHGGRPHGLRSGIITAAALGDRLGRGRVYVLGLAVFTAASAACAPRSTSVGPVGLEPTLSGS
jgi:MFS family permease